MSDVASKPPGRVLITDFDGTMTRRDFFQLVVERLLPVGTHDYWGDYLAGRMTHFEALKAIYGSVAAGETALLELVSLMELEPTLKAEVEALQSLGWRVVVASAGCEWYIRKLLAKAGVTLEVHANPGRIEGGRLVMELPIGAPYFSRETGVDKVAIVQSAIDEGNVVAFAGDGHPDLAPSLLVPGSLRFARGVLAEELKARGEEFRPFERWSEVASFLRRPG
jgi:2-hydroxy-3-keto-5-methylthiopentenyl-1-phosphate phosphatase